jgi:N-acetylmuramoyl-L-alanine amidase
MLKSIYYHPGATIESPHLELGDMVLFFSESVFPLVIHKKELSQEHMMEQKMLFAHVVINDEQVQKMIERINSQKTEGYTINITAVKIPVEGLEVVIVYNKKQVQFTYDTLVSPAALPGYIFRFINHAFYTELSKKVTVRPVTHTVLKKQRPCIVIDPGHGGQDTGAIGVGRLPEKMVTLNISKEVKRYLYNYGCDILLTRSTDTFLTLDERTALANAVGADLFVSIHANAAPNKDAAGIETFFYPHGEGKVVGTSQGFKDHTLFDDYLKNKSEQSTLLASSIQQSLCAQVYPVHLLRDKIDRKVKKAPFQVLMGAAQPGVLVEVGFLTHEYEGDLLRSKKYQKRVAQGIVKGILSYLKTDYALV